MEIVNITINQKEFIIQTFLSNTQSSSFQRGCVYVEDIYEQDKQPFVIAFHDKLKSLKEKYQETVSEKDHIKNIIQFQDELTEEFPTILRNERMRLGTAQKAVNLYLKFLWCLGDIKMPPHCPIDGKVLTEIGANVRWTELDDVEEYRGIIDLIRIEAGNQSIAEWELEFWQPG